MTPVYLLYINIIEIRRKQGIEPCTRTPARVLSHTPRSERKLNMIKTLL